MLRRVHAAVTRRHDGVLCCTERPLSLIHPCYGGRVPGMDLLRGPSPLTHPALTHKSLSKVSLGRAGPAGSWPPPLPAQEPLQINQKRRCNNFPPLPSARIYLPSSSSLSGRISFSQHERLKSVYNFCPLKSLLVGRSSIMELPSQHKLPVDLLLLLIVVVFMILIHSELCGTDRNVGNPDHRDHMTENLLKFQEILLNFSSELKMSVIKAHRSSFVAASTAFK